MKIQSKLVLLAATMAVGATPALAAGPPSGTPGSGNAPTNAGAPSNPGSQGSGNGSGGQGSDRATAQKQCRQERTKMGAALFDQTYGTNKNHRNAFGKCVSHRVAQDTADQQSAQQNAPQTCRAEQNDPNFAANHNGESFDEFYGTNGNNAFGMCVSSVAKSQAGQDETGQVSAEDNAAKQCRAEQKADPAAFKDKYGTNANKSNAFGKCVSSKARTQENSGGSGSSSGSGSG